MFGLTHNSITLGLPDSSQSNKRTLIFKFVYVYMINE